MASSGPDRSIGMSYFPQWMKSKFNDRYDLEQTMAFSPPNNDDGFFILKYRRYEEPTATPKPKIVEPKFTPKLQTFDEHPTSTPSLKQFIATDPTPREVGMRLPGEHALTKIKSSSSSSEDKETPPPFGHSSIVAVAHQMIADSKNHDLQTDSIPHRLRVRRNSKSLPTSPQSSPKMFRKNPFFTNIFFGSSELVNVTEETKPVTRTTSTEDARLESWSSKVVRAFSDVDAASPTMKSPPPVKALKAKPSELREMNFWSPTSM